MDYNKLELQKLKALVKTIKKIYFSNISSLTKEECIKICEKFPIPAKNQIEILKKAPDSSDSEYDF
jgi:hypothetical protein